MIHQQRQRKDQSSLVPMAPKALSYNHRAKDNAERLADQVVLKTMVGIHFYLATTFLISAFLISAFYVRPCSPSELANRLSQSYVLFKYPVGRGRRLIWNWKRKAKLPLSNE